jgi:hypothetical protein
VGVLKRTLVVATAAVALAATASAGTGNGVVASAKGGYGFRTSSVDVGPFTWHVQLHADGSVDGGYDYTQVSLSSSAALTVKGPIICAVIIGNHVWVGGIIEESSRDSLIGLNMWFQAQDNGEGGNAPPDMSTTIGAGGPGTAQQYCDDHPPALFPHLIELGNLQVSS